MAFDLMLGMLLIGLGVAFLSMAVVRYEKAAMVSDTVLKQEADPSEAEENLSTGIEIFKECGADGWVRSHEEELSNT